MKRIIVAVFAVMALALGYPSASSADKPDNPGQSQVHKKDNDSCKKKSCGQPHGQSCKHANVHKTWCGSKHGEGDDDPGDHHGTPALADTGA